VFFWCVRVTRKVQGVVEGSILRVKRGLEKRPLVCVPGECGRRLWWPPLQRKFHRLCRRVVTDFLCSEMSIGACDVSLTGAT
jgi:hypothetical protein